MDSGLNVIVIDDDEDDYFLIKDILLDIFPDCSVDWSATLAEGEAQLSGNRHDICLLDLNLGGDSGLELLEKAPSMGFNNPIIMLTGQDDIATDKKAASIGAADYIVKGSLSPTHMSRSIRYALERKNAMDERLKRTQAEAGSRAKSLFLANLSHELRSPLTSILGYSELLIGQQLGEEATEKLSIIHRNGSHLLHLINDVLDFSKIEAGKIHFESIEINLEKLLSSVFKSIQISAIHKGLRLDILFDSALPLIIYTDLTRLRQILLNILNNAIKYTDEGSITLSVGAQFLNADSTGITLERHLPSDDYYQLTFSITDTGIGIPENKLATIFEPFSQVGDSHTAMHDAGLGLSICKKLVSGLGGDISVTSTLGKGSCFQFSVPVSTPKNVEQKRFSLIPIKDEIVCELPKNSLDLHSTILVVDDIDDVRHLLGHYVEQAGGTPLYARNGKEAIEQIASDPSIAAVFMDLQMPVIDGYQAAVEIRSRRSDIYMCALTASTNEGNIHKAYEAGFDDFLSKPIDIVKIHDLLCKNLLKKPYESARYASSHRKKSVLVIEDNPDVLKITTTLIEHCDWLTSGASSARESIDFLEKQCGIEDAFPDLIFLDIGLPDMDAEELVSHIYKIAPRVPIVILSGQEPSKAIIEMPNVDSAILKPVTLSALKSTLALYRQP